MKVEFNASLMCADFGNLAKELRLLQDAGVDSFHIDIMDGRFVDNFAMSLCDLCFIAKVAKTPLDVHLMVEHPRVHIDKILQHVRPGDTIYIHPESEYHPSTTLNRILAAGMVPGIAINPCTSIESVYEIIHIAKLANLNLKEEEIDKYTSDMEDILNFANTINQVNTEGVEDSIGNSENEEWEQDRQALIDAIKSNSQYLVNTGTFKVFNRI